MQDKINPITPNKNQIAFSCSVCYGEPNHPVTIGMTKAIWFLLGVIGFILSCIAYGMITLIRKNKQINI
jgi:hypothetical protein